MKHPLPDIFNQIKTLLQKYEKVLAAKTSENTYELNSTKEIEVLGKKKDGMYFAGLMVRKNYVVLYFMPVYTDPELKENIDPTLLKKLKGKSCFQFNQWDETLEKNLENMLKMGFDAYQKKGWI